MDYLLNTYLFRFLPFDVAEETKKEWGQKAMGVVMWADWLCRYQDPWKIYENHTSFLFGELLFFLLCALTFVHAYRNGARYMTVWVAILVHALNVENLCYWIPDMDNFWQAQGILTFFGMRAPLYIILGIYHMFDYSAYVMVSRLRLPWWAEGPAVGLCAVMLDMPYDIMGIKQLWWTWHDTDPNILQRMYWVPWTSYYFHASFACSLVFLMKFSRKYLIDEVYDWKKLPREYLCSVIAGMGAFWLGVMQFGVFYHPLRDHFHVHTEIIVCLFLGFYAIVVIYADRRNNHPEARLGNKYWFDEIACAIALEYLFYMVLVVVADPENIVAEGLHQPIGNCNETQTVRSFVKVLSKGKYLCLEDYDEKYFDFHCIPKGGFRLPEDGSALEWYAVCGTPFENQAEYVTIIWGICILYGFIFYMIAKSSTIPVYPVKQYRLREKVQPAEREKLVRTSPSSPKKTFGKSLFSPVKTTVEEMDDNEPVAPQRDIPEATLFKTPRLRGRPRKLAADDATPQQTPRNPYLPSTETSSRVLRSRGPRSQNQ